MAWTTPRTWTALETVTASLLNTHVRDNLSYLKSGLDAVPGRNLLHNGAFQVAQRGTSTASITGSGYYTADRWYLALGSLGTFTQSVENDAPTGSGFRKSLKLLCTTADASPAASDVALVQQHIEGQNLQNIKKGTSSAQQVTLSFWVKSNKTGTYIVELIDGDNSRNVSASYTISSSATWEQKTLTFPADLTGAFDNDENASLSLNFWLATGSTYSGGSSLQTTWTTLTNNKRAYGQTNLAAATNNYWQVTGVQLEVGSAATGFEFKNYGTELAECQRYYYRHAAGAVTPVGIGYYWNNSAATMAVHFPTTMRSAPVIDQVTGTNYYIFSRNGGSDYFDTFSLNLACPSNALADISPVSGTAGDAGAVLINNASGYLGFSADL